mmetsp:Transcript_25930/g.38310  ORF Transcript_25930/g.38310 Transcript_25930/m.38310 type:complete len:344 (-) Transcript_25930:42-1073(-)|eukprot:CAMPEP_0194248828 /NCGR_PEP_ID=MMETSP0158-20130606/19199_1 /TAXON_ID=33649 /ORGANISM="Thalassionema nitzschioides, Strain L26-B" /LENGTH=343 /DNA_ID=CAMNT_0038985225 /DNA_START=1 /DNA_END=1032 /DNA_ORIENTATION=+
MSAKIRSCSLGCFEERDDPTAADVSFLKEVLKRSPFLFLAKTTPETLPNYNVKKDFKYFYISDYMTHFSCLHSKLLRRASRAKSASDVTGMMFPIKKSMSLDDGNYSLRSFPSPSPPPSPLLSPSSPVPSSPMSAREVINATLLFPDTYEPTFQEDVNVTLNYQYPINYSVVEKFIRPGIDTIVHTTKTAAIISHRRYILNVDAVYDDVEMGITKFKSTRLPAEMSDLERVPLRWFEGAFVNFPLAMAIVDKFGQPVKQNGHMKNWGKWQSAVEECMQRVREVRLIDRSKDCWELSLVRVEEEGTEHRVWVWKPRKDDLYAVCFRRHHGEIDCLPDPITRNGV